MSEAGERWPRRAALIGGLLIALLAGLATLVLVELKVSVTRADIVLATGADRDVAPLRVAVVGDLHVGHGVVDVGVLDRLFDAVVAEDPDIVLLVGDYTANVGDGIDRLRPTVVAKIAALSARKPTFAVLGNYETWTGAEAWLEGLRRAGIAVLENEITTATVGGSTVCIRGLGDFYTGRFRHVDWPSDCGGRTRITLTHDPAAAFLRPYEGVVFAGHTHCGQVRFPFLGALWIPSTAPKPGTCGLYRDSHRTLYVTAGVGTSILPIRLGAPSAWDLVTLRGK